MTYAPKKPDKGYVLWTGGIADVMFRGRYNQTIYSPKIIRSHRWFYDLGCTGIQMVFRPSALCRWGNHQYVRQQTHEHQRDYMSAGRLMNIKGLLTSTDKNHDI